MSRGSSRVNISSHKPHTPGMDGTAEVLQNSMPLGAAYTTGMAFSEPWLKIEGGRDYCMY
jgi:hypothetical protein